MTQHFFGAKISYRFSTMHTASYEFLMKPKELPGCHQTLSTRVGSGDETSNIITTLTSYKQREGLSVTNLSLENKPPGLHTYLYCIHTCTLNGCGQVARQQRVRVGEAPCHNAV